MRRSALVQGDTPAAVPAPGRVAVHPGRNRRWAFYTLVGVTVLMFAAPMAPFLVIPVAWPFLGERLGVHQLHDVSVATMLWFMIAGLLAQFRGPSARSAPCSRLSSFSSSGSRSRRSVGWSI